MGLLDEIQDNSNKSTYTSTYTGKLSKLIEDALFSKDEDIESPEIVLYTGLGGFYIFQLFMMGFGVPQVHYTFEHLRRVRHIIVLNLFRKSGLIKAIINTRTHLVEIRKGTEVLKEAFDFNKIGDYLASLTPKEPQEFYLKNGNRKFIK